MRNLDEYIKILEDSQSVDCDLSFEMLADCSCQIDASPSYSRILCINVLNNWNKIHESTKEAWGSIIEALGFYPYLNKERIELVGTLESIRRFNHDSAYLEGKTHHDDQRTLINLIFSNKNVVASAPTSFGKSLIIEEIIASRKWKNIVIIQPTLALLDETRRKIQKYITDYKLIVRTSQTSSLEKGNIYLFTAERVNEYDFPIRVDFLIIDEFYKLSGSRDDERSSSLNNAFYKLYWKFKPQFYLLGPNIDGVSNGFLEYYNAIFYHSDCSLVDSRVIDIYRDYPDQIGTRGKKRNFTEKLLFQLLLEHSSEQSIIYCSSPERVRGVAKRFTDYCSNHIEQSVNNLPLEQWIKDNISEHWMLLKALKYGIGIHDGALQKHITNSIIDYFNQGKLRYLFCTSTIIEGVNTSAKNVVYFDKKKGPNDVDYFDYSNIKGRAGRMMEHYIGRVYNFYPIPSVTKINIDIPLYDQKPIKDEVLVQLENEHIHNKASKQYQEITAIPADELTVIRKNGLSVKGQKRIIDILMSELPAKHDRYYWNTRIFPNYHQLEKVLTLAWDNLVVEGESTRPMTKARLIGFTNSYLRHKDEAYLVRTEFDYLSKQKGYENKSESEIYDVAIQNVFQTIRHWMQYKVPKWLSVVSELQRFVCEKKGLASGNYTGIANLIENSFIPDNLSILVEYGIPVSAVRKISNKLPKGIAQDEVWDYVKNNNIADIPELIEYERYKILQNI